MLALADLSGLSEDTVKDRIAEEYAGDKSGFDYGFPSDAEKAKLRDELKHFDILVAFQDESGYEGSSWFLLREKDSGTLYEATGSHCSCYGFEGQWKPEITTLEYLTSDRFWVPEYDGSQPQIIAYIAALAESAK